MLNSFKSWGLIISHLRLSYILSESYICIHAPELTPFGLKISLDDWKVFKEIKDNGEKVLRVIKMLSGRQKMPEDEE